MNFDEAERKFAGLKDQRDSGQISPAEFSSHVDEIRLQDIGGVWWQISEKNGQWLRWNGSAWVPGEPVRITGSSMQIRYPVSSSESPPSTPQVPLVSTLPVYTRNYHYPAEDSDNKRKYILSGILGIILILTALVFFNIGGIQDILGLSGPENTVFKYYQAVDSGDYDGGFDLLVTESLQPLDEDYRTRIAQHNAVTLGYGIHGEGIEFKNLTVTNKQKITDKKYIIDVTGTVVITSLPSGTVQKRTHYATFIVVDINGNWKLVFPHRVWNIGSSSGTY